MYHTAITIYSSIYSAGEGVFIAMYEINDLDEETHKKCIVTTINELPIHIQERIAILQMLDGTNAIPGVGVKYEIVSPRYLASVSLYFDDYPTWVDELTNERNAHEQA